MEGEHDEMADPYEGRFAHPDYPPALGAIYLMPDDDLLAAIDELAQKSHPRQGPIGYYLRELERRQQQRLNKTMVRLTWAVVALTVVAAAAGVVGTIAVLTGS